MGTKNRTYFHSRRFILASLNSLIAGPQRCRGRKRGYRRQTNYYYCLQQVLSRDLPLNECHLGVTVRRQLICLRTIPVRRWWENMEYPNPQVSVRSEADRRLKGPQGAKQRFRESSKPEAPSGDLLLSEAAWHGDPVRRAPHLPWVQSDCFLQLHVLESALGLDVQMWTELYNWPQNESLFFPNGREGNRFLRGFLITAIYCITKHEFSTRKDGTRNKGASWEDRKASHVLHLGSMPSQASLLDSGDLLLQILFLGPKGSSWFS